MTQLESLPNELLLFIFSYLHKFDLLNAFITLNQRFEQIIEPYLHDINLTDKNWSSYSTFRLFYDHVLPFKGHHIRSFEFATYQQLELFRPHVYRFVNLQSVTIQTLKNTLELKPFLTAVLSLPSLSELSLSSVEKDVLETISSCALPNFSKLTLSDSQDSSDFNDMLFIMPTIRHFTVTLKYLKTLLKLLILMPNLQELNLSISSFDNLNDVSSLLVLPEPLEILHLEFGGHIRSHFSKNFVVEFVMMKKFLSIFKNQLRSITLIGITTNEKDFFNYDTFQSLVENYTHLEKFRYYIQTNYQPDPRFPKWEQLPDSSYSFFTQPKPKLFDRTSARVAFECGLYSSLTFQELFNSQTLTISDMVRLPTTFQLENNVKLVNLQQLYFEDPIEDFELEIRQYLAKMISLAPNLDTVTVRIAWHGPQIPIQRLKEIFTPKEKQLKFFDIPIIYDGPAKNYRYQSFVSELSSVFPNLKKLTIYMELETINDCYTSFFLFLDDLRNQFPKLTYLTIRMWLRDQDAFDMFKNQLNELSNQNTLLYQLVDRDSDNSFYYCYIWL